MKTRIRRQGIGVSIALLLVLLASCGRAAEENSRPGPNRPTQAVEWAVPDHRIVGLHQRVVGEGPRAAVLLWATGSPPPRRVVIFFHGWQAAPPSVDAEWIRHLAESPATIVYPVYQQGSTRPAEFRADAIAGIRTALATLPGEPDQLLAIGRTTGAALALDFAAVAGREELPAPEAVLAIFPGRRPPGGTIPPPRPTRLPRGTWVTVIGGAGDPLPGGPTEARRSLAAAGPGEPGRRRLLEPSFPSDLSATPPSEALDAQRRAFWRPADQLIEELERN